jgi:DNA-binding transcriptional MerR regulator
MATEYLIRDLVEEFDVTARAIRFYEEKGLLSPRREGQSRIFSSSDRTRLKLILRGKRLGFTLEESSEIIGMYEHGKSNRKQLQSLIEKIREKREQLLKQQQELELMLDDLSDAEEQCVNALVQL